MASLSGYSVTEFPAILLKGQVALSCNKSLDYLTKICATLETTYVRAPRGCPFLSEGPRIFGIMKKYEFFVILCPLENCELVQKSDPIVTIIMTSYNKIVKILVFSRFH